MPLYGRGLRRRSVLRLALAANRLLSTGCNNGVRLDRRLPAGRVLSVSDTLARFPRADRAGLQGGALWFDAVVADSQRLLIELLHWATASGATALNYVEAKKLEVTDGRVRAVVARDRETDALLEYRAPIVVNCAGPWNRIVAQRFDRDVRQLLHPMSAFNLFLDVEPEFDCAVGVTPGRPGAQTYFLYPWKGGLLAGTYQTSWREDTAFGPPDSELVESFLGDLRAAIPGLDVGREQVVRVFWGFLPTTGAGSDRLAVRDVIHHHAESNGPTGLFSVTGVKLTTARRVAERTLRAVHRHAGTTLPLPSSQAPPTPTIPPSLEDFRALVRDDSPAARELVERVIETESVVRLEDLLLRRTDWGTHPTEGRDVAERVHTLVNWGPERPPA
jgi:glycerol-3-phosphate dehydrogenase